MSTKASYTEDEWKVLQWAVMNAGAHVSASDYPGLWNSFKEAAGGSRFLTLMQSSDDDLVRDLARDQARKRDPETKDRADLAGDVALARIREAVALVASKDPADVEPFQWLIVGTAQAIAEEVKGVSDKESVALARVRDAVGLPPSGAPA